MSLPADCLLRIARLADLPTIVAIYNETIPSRMVTADLQPVSVADRQAWFAAHTADKHPLWVLEQGGNVIGWASLSPFYGRAAYGATAEISLYLTKSAQGHGLGRKLLEQVMHDCPQLNIRTLLGFIFSHNQPSLKLFERVGFGYWGELPDVAELDGARRSLTIMGKEVTQ